MPFQKNHKINVGSKLNDETKEKMRQSHIIFWNSPEGQKQRLRLSELLKGRKISLESKLKRTGRTLSVETKNKISIAHKGLKHSIASMEKMSKSHKGISFSEIHRANMKGHFPNEEIRIKLSMIQKGHKVSDETKTKIRNAIRQVWLNPVYHERTLKAMFKSIGVSPNKAEKYLLYILDCYFPNEWKYVGNGDLIVAGKCPDFMNVNGKKALIELYGDYWHKNHNPEDRKQIFKPYGYETLIIWERELKDKEQIISKIKNAFYQEGEVKCQN